MGFLLSAGRRDPSRGEAPTAPTPQPAPPRLTLGIPITLVHPGGLIGETLKAEGYRTALLGKSHLQNGVSRLSTRNKAEAPATFEAWPDVARNFPQIHKDVVTVRRH